MSESTNTNRYGQEMSDPVTSILLRFPGPITLRASRKKWGLMLLISAGFVGVFVYLLYFDQSERAPGPFLRMIFWSGLFFFGLGIPLAAVLLVLPGSSRLVLHETGFEITQIFKSHRILWTDATGFQVSYINPGRGELSIVVFDDAKQK